MNQDKIKEILMDIQPSELEFTITFTGKESKKVNGLYKPETCEILLHNKNFNADNQLIYTAIHEYTHHLINEEKLEESGGLKPSYNRVHTNEFWAKFHGLLEIAEQKGYYVIGLENSPELAELTEEIRNSGKSTCLMSGCRNPIRRLYRPYPETATQCRKIHCESFYSSNESGYRF